MTIRIKGHEVLIDEVDWPRISQYKWCAFDHGRYFMSRKAGTTLHRFIVGARKGEVVDHINRDTHDNRRCNLRIVSHRSNLLNCKLYRNNPSGVRGVRRRDSKWHAYIVVWGKQINLGRFATLREAAEARRKAEQLYWPNELVGCTVAEGLNLEEAA